MRRHPSPGRAGAVAEEQARSFLERQGLTCMVRNYRCRLGEIDLIMRHQDTLVFVEVRYRGRSDFGTGAETVTMGKQRRLLKAAAHFLQSQWGGPAPACRFDVLAINGKDEQNIEWITDAFQAN